MIWHSSDIADILTELSVDDKKGLANGEATDRIESYGENVILKAQKLSFWQRFFLQLKGKTVIALVIISLISFVVSLIYSDTSFWTPLLIIAIVIINAFISAYYIFSSDNTLDDIKKITNPAVKVLRDGVVKNISSQDLVPGDIIILEEGDYIPADARVIESNEFRCNEIVLTSVEVPVEKCDCVLEEITPFERRSNMIYSGTSVAHGTAKAVVVATGINTEMGKSSLILEQTSENKLPLEDSLSSIGKVANTFILIVCLIVFVVALIQNFSAANFANTTLKALVNSLALAVAAIPEGLPAITTIVIALGMHRILKDNIIVKDASAAELLGKTDIICCDKTGVFTRNKMVLAKIYDGEKLYDLEAEGINESTTTILKLATACSTLENDSTEDAIEKASLIYNSMSLMDVKSLFPQITEIPFDSYRKTMTVITMINEQPIAIVKGAPETVIPNCIECDNEAVLKLNNELAEDAYRNVCIAMKKLDTIPVNPTSDEIERDLTFVGLLSLYDPPREGVVDQIAACDKAGIKTVMITGDNLSTAKAIARRIGILKDGTFAITGPELDEMTDDELAANIEKYTVFARVSANDKLRLVKAWQQNKKIVTITGDSVNDADALALADVGCAIGKFGADVAKGNADIIISNNRFGSIVDAIKESRGLFSNIKKSVNYLFSSNFAELLVVLFGLLLFGQMPVAAVGLLWINLLTDCAPAMALSMEKAEDACALKHSPSSINRIFNLKSSVSMLIQSVAIALVTLISYALGRGFDGGVVSATMAFTTLGITQILHCLNNKYEGTLFGKKLFDNKFMNYAVILTVFIVLFLVFTPAGSLFGLTILNFSQFITAFLLSLVIIPVTEITKRLPINN